MSVKANVNNRIPKRLITIFAIFFIFMVVSNELVRKAMAEGTKYYPNAETYELKEESDFDCSKGSAQSGELSFGRKTIGNISINGTGIEEAAFRGVTAYGATGDITIGYEYDGAFQSGKKTEWNIIKDSAKKVNSIDIGEKVKRGAVVIQSSADNYTWKTVKKYTDFFEDNKKGKSNLYTANVSEISEGVYYRIYVAYTMEKQTKSGSITDWNGEWSTKQFVEVYHFFLCYENNPVKYYDIISRDSLISGGKTDNGFFIDKCGSSDRVTVSRDGNEAIEISDMQEFVASGIYTINITTKLGKKYVNTIQVNDGTSIKILKPTVYVSKDDDGYPLDKKLNDKTVFDDYSYTSLSLGQSANKYFRTSTKGDFASYGITGDSINIFLKIKYNSQLTANGWKIANDDWGEKKKQKVNGVETGRVGTGALIIQKSSDGKKWVEADRGRYAEGLYTTSFSTHYGDGSDVLIYTPKGEDVINGLYLRILFAYEVKDATGKNVKNYVEEYKFYLCSSNLESVTFHNLSVTDEMNTILDSDDQIVLNLYKKAETLLPGDYTVSGFEIDKSLNETVSISVKKDGRPFEIPSDNKITATGKYDITIQSDVGNVKSITLYVDRMSDRNSFNLYFGDSFVTGKRIYTELDVPTFEAGETAFHINAVSQNYKKIVGKITNHTTGEVKDISSSSTEQNIVITDAGQYSVLFTTKDAVDSDLESGDAKSFSFEFNIIAQGTAPGPQLNQQFLMEYSKNSMVGSVPKFYCLSYNSAAKGNIYVAYSSWEAALAAAYEDETNSVERQEDGTFRYTGKYQIKDKEKYNSAWELTDAKYYFAEQAIEIKYFDLSDPYTYTTLRSSLIDTTENLRTLELSRSVVIFADGQKELLTDIDALPIINDVTSLYLNPGLDQKPIKEKESFKFVSDKYGCDSASIVIYDKNNNEYLIEYNKSVDEQLTKAGCPSGIIKIHEETIYGDFVEYESVYFAEGENAAELVIEYCRGDTKSTQRVSALDDGKIIVEADYFTISDILDSLDPYAIIRVSNGGSLDYFCINEVINRIWATPGDYEITSINRMGYAFTVKVRIKESENLVISFQGLGTGKLDPILTSKGQTNIILPTLEDREGLVFAGYKDLNGNEYKGSIAAINVTGELILEPKWISPDGNEKAPQKRTVFKIILGVLVLGSLVGVGFFSVNKFKKRATNDGVSTDVNMGESDENTK